MLTALGPHVTRQSYFQFSVVGSLPWFASRFFLKKVTGSPSCDEPSWDRTEKQSLVRKQSKWDWEEDRVWGSDFYSSIHHHFITTYKGFYTHPATLHQRTQAVTPNSCPLTECPTELRPKAHAWQQRSATSLPCCRTQLSVAPLSQAPDTNMI
jgi:hypothetical protein